ncbi:MAG: hypothetical protein JWR16_1479 [Nevskia sp.]|nr:hypothetical protein [Nevskia sp.]
MRTLNRWITALSRILARAGLCAVSGLLIGLIAGLLLLLVSCAGAGTTLTPQQIVEVGLMVALPGFLLLVWVLVALLRYPSAAIVGPALANAVLTGVLTVALVAALHAWIHAVLLGMLVGLIVGRLLCLLGGCPREVRHGLQ